jgi:signal transduction histidine kinase
MLMVFGEGAVFLTILFFGIWRLSKSIQQELALHQRQSNFLLSVTHELKTPLASVQLILQTMQRRTFEPQQINEFTEKALEENKKSQELIEHILHASGIEQNALNVHINTLYLEDFLSGFIPLFPASKYNIIWKNSNNSSFQCDINMLIFILKNLIENSFKYGANKVEVEFIYNTKYFEIKVSDNGIGVLEKDRPYIFDKFYRSGDDKIRDRSGTGLGLYIAREMALLQGGEINYQPLTEGSCFIVSLPHGT